MCLAIPGKVISIDEEEPIFRAGKVSFNGIVKTVNLSCVPDAAVGDYVLVHVGLAISKIDEKEAKRVFEYLEEMGELEELENINSS